MSFLIFLCLTIAPFGAKTYGNDGFFKEKIDHSTFSMPPNSAPAFIGVENATNGNNVTNLSINVPNGNIDDVLIATIATDGNTNFSTPSGWTLVDNAEGVGQAASGAATLAVYYRIVDGTEPSVYTFSWSGSQEAIGAITRYSGVDPLMPIDAFGVATGTSDAPTAPSVSTSVNDAMIIRIFGADGDGGNSASEPSGTTEAYIDRSSSVSGDAASLGIAYVTQASIGATGTAAFSNNNEQWRAITLALAPFTGPSCNPNNVSAYTSTTTCNGNTANSDGQITLSSAMDADRYALVVGNGFIANGGDPNYANAISFNEATDLPLVLRNDLPNPTSSKDYTIRVFNGETACFRDLVVTLNEIDCSSTSAFQSSCDMKTDFTAVGTAGFEDSSPENEQCITLADWGIDPTKVVQDFNVSLFFDGGLNSVTFTTENGQSVAGTIGSFFAEATLQADGSTFICATIDATNDSRAEDMSFFALIPEMTDEAQFGYAGLQEPIDDEIFNQPCGSTAPTGTIPITLSGNPNDFFDIQIDVPVSEVELNDPRTITFNFTACNSTFSQSINPEPLIGRPGGFNILTATLEDVPGNCTQIDYEFCSNSGEQSYGVAFVLVKYECELGSIGSTVFMDTDNDGQFEVGDGEMGIGGVTVNLNQVAIVQDGGYLDLDGDMMGNDPDDDGSFAGITVIDGALDLDGDGQIEANGDDDGPVDGLTVDDGRIVGIPDGGQAIAFLATTTTATMASGNVEIGDYFFGSLPEGMYQVEIPASNFVTNTDPLFDKPFSSIPTDTNDNGEDNDDNGIQTGGMGAVTVSPVITLTIGGEPQNESGQGGMQDSDADDNGDMTIDFGFQTQPLPVELLAFTAEAEKDLIYLTWSTATEIDNDYFELERSENGKTFKSIAQIDGGGNSLMKLHYKYKDNSAIEGILYYYRLKQVDFDGSFEYSEIISAKLNTSASNLTVFPNPVNTQIDLNLRYYSTDFEEVIIVNDLQGREVKRYQVSTTQNSWNDLQLNIEGLSAGIYFIKTERGEVIRFVKMEQ
ncbi:MAG: T9SS type A sorting domain-containing protein [Bacteroidota bacterium]